MAEKRLLLVDGFNLLSRGYFATSFGKEEEELAKNAEGIYINAVRVFFTKMFQVIRNYSITHVSVSWDGKREDTDRNKEHSFYKAQRKDLPSPLIEQYHTCVDLLEKMNIHQLAVPGFEADDIIGTFSHEWSNKEIGDVIILSNDRDLFQLINEKTSQLVMRKKEEVCFGLTEFVEEFQLDPSQWVEVKALLGDSSDNIPGCPGVGEKSAYPLIREYGSIEKLYQSMETLNPLYKRYKKKLIEGEALVKISYELSQVIIDIPQVQEINDGLLEFKKNIEDINVILENYRTKIKS